MRFEIKPNTPPPVVVPDGSERLSFNYRVFPNERRSLWAVAPVADAETVLTWLLTEAVTRQLDRFVASSKDIERQWKHPMHASAYEAAWQLGFFMDGIGQASPPSAQECVQRLEPLLPSLLFLCAESGTPPHAERVAALNYLKRTVVLLKQRIAAAGGASCHKCLRPAPACICKPNPEA